MMNKKRMKEQVDLVHQVFARKESLWQKQPLAIYVQNVGMFLLDI